MSLFFPHLIWCQKFQSTAKMCEKDHSSLKILQFVIITVLIMGMVIWELKNINSKVASCVVKLTLLFL